MASCRRVGDGSGTSHACRAAGLAASAGSRPEAGVSGLRGAAFGCPAAGPTGSAASTRRRSARSAGISAGHTGVTEKWERERQWRRSSRCGEPSESDIFGAVSGRGMVCAAWFCVPQGPSSPLVRRWSAWVVPCGARGPRGGHWQRPSG